MNNAINTVPKTVEKKMLKELECRKLLSPRIIEGDLNEALTDSDEMKNKIQTMKDPLNT